MTIHINWLLEKSHDELASRKQTETQNYKSTVRLAVYKLRVDIAAKNVWSLRKNINVCVIGVVNGWGATMLLVRDLRCSFKCEWLEMIMRECRNYSSFWLAL